MFCVVDFSVSCRDSVCCDGSGIVVVVAAAPEQAGGDGAGGRAEQGGGAGAVAGAGGAAGGLVALQPGAAQPGASPAPLPSRARGGEVPLAGASGGLLALPVCGRAHARGIRLQSECSCFESKDHTA